jgi:hypothetical protein
MKSDLSSTDAWATGVSVLTFSCMGFVVLFEAMTAMQRGIDNTIVAQLQRLPPKRRYQGRR